MNRTVSLIVCLFVVMCLFWTLSGNEIFKLVVPQPARVADHSSDSEEVEQPHPHLALTDEQQLIVAAFELDVATVERLIKAGVNVNATMQEHDDKLFQDKWSGGWFAASKTWTPLIALSSSHREPQPDKLVESTTEGLEAAEKLRAAIPQAEIDKRNQLRLQIAKMLVDAGAKLDADDGYGATCLYNAAHNDYSALVLYFIGKNAKVNTKTGVYIDEPGDDTPLHRATGNSKIVDALIKAGADVNAKDTSGNTPLHMATLLADVESVKLLIAAGADVNATNRENKRPIQWANEPEPADKFRKSVEGVDKENANEVAIYELLKKAGATSK